VEDAHSFSLQYFTKLMSELDPSNINSEYFSFLTTFSNLMLLVSKNQKFYDLMKTFMREFEKKFSLSSDSFNPSDSISESSIDIKLPPIPLEIQRPIQLEPLSLPVQLPSLLQEPLMSLSLT
jgi:hypothetical protein